MGIFNGKLSRWLQETQPKTGSGHELPKGVRTRGKIKPEQIVYRDGPTQKPIKPKKKK